MSPGAQPSDVASVRVDPDGVVALLHYRDCGDVRQYVWIRQEPPEVIAAIALGDIRTRLLAQPVPQVSPGTRGVVNVESWLAVSDPGEQSATASIPGRSVTATARVTSTTWSFDDGGGAPVVVECEGLGERWEPSDGERPAPCGHTFVRPTVGSPLTVRVHVTWAIEWVASGGASGTLEPITSDAAVFDYPIDEIQTIGTSG